ncbi:MAG: hypothetical protein Q9208_001639 [Pyrenodesmia sp. 3 TL-2023]
MYARRLKFMEALERKVSPLEKYHVDVVGLNEDTREEIAFLRKKLGICSPVSEMVGVPEGEDDCFCAEDHGQDSAMSLHIQHDAARATEPEQEVEPIPVSDPDGEHTIQPPTQLDPMPNRSDGNQIPRTSILSNVFHRTSNHQGKDITLTRLQMIRKTRTRDLAPDPMHESRRGGIQSPPSTGVSTNFLQPEELPLPIIKTDDDPTMRNTFANAVTGTYFVEEEGSELTEESDTASASSVITYDGARDLGREAK